MANIESQIKRIKKSGKERLRSKGVKSSVRTYIRQFNAAFEEKNKKKAKEALNKVVQALDKAASKRAIHKNNAANKKSKMMKKFNTLDA